MHINEVLNNFRLVYIRKNSSPTSDKNKAKIEYISEGQPSLHELAFGVELGLNSHSKNLRWYHSISEISVGRVLGKT